MTVAQLKERIDARFKAVDTRFKAVDTRFDAVDKRFDAVDKRFDAVDKRFDAVDRRFDAMDEKLDAILASIKQKYKHHDRVVDEHDGRLKDLEAWRRTSQDIAR